MSNYPPPQHPLSETLAPGAGIFIAPTKTLADEQSKFQHIEFFETESFGRVFRLDGHFMTSERDEFFYHETLTHPAILASGATRNILIIGGGDGGSAKECLKYAGVERIDVVEIDERVVALSKKYFREMNRDCFSDPRVHLFIEDGKKYIEATRDEFDLIVLDLTDPGGMSEALYTKTFFAQCLKHLSAKGALTLHIGSPLFQWAQCKRIFDELSAVFSIVTPLLISVPLYGGWWLMGCASQALKLYNFSAKEIDESLASNAIHDLKFYNGAVHRAMLALPNFIRKKLL
jgi:spermidine synthase